MKRETICLLFVFFTVCLGCESLYQLTNSGKGCVIAVNYNDSSCSQFDLLQCKYTECVSHFIFCIDRERQVSQQWSVCSAKCCPQDNVYNQSAEGIKMCQEHLNSGGEWQRIVAICVISFILLLFVVVLVKKIYQRCTNQRNNLALFPAQQPGSHQYQLQEHHNQGQVIQNDQQWHKCDSYDKSSVCGVCLEGQTNLKLKCGHFYHQTCIAQWLKQKKDCPFCKKTVTDIATVYCHNCHSYSQNIKMPSSLPSGSRECPNCSDPAGEKMFN